MTFDLLIAGGELPGRGQFDVAIADGKIASVDTRIPHDVAREVVDATGLLVVPGLVDLHAHVFPDVTYWGVDADALAPAAGVTTWVDAGSAGAFTIRGFRRFVVEPARVRIKAFLNVSSIGLVAPSWEVAARRYLDEEQCLRAVEANRDLVVGLKVRIDRFTVGRLGLEPLEVALRLAGQAELPLMTHIGHGPPALGEVLARLRPGDILTHCATAASMSLVDGSGTVVPGVREAVERGVLLDIGHGSGAFSFRVAEALLAAGLAPRTISSDAHQHSVNGPMFDLPTCMTKLLALGMSLEDVVTAATTEPARLIGAEATLTAGALADVTLLAQEPGPFRITDVTGATREAPLRLRAARTFVGGKELAPAPLPLPPPWIELSEQQRAVRERAARGERVDLPLALDEIRELPPLAEADD
jgi:dihydroorotase